MSAGYSGTPLAKKLGIKDGFTVLTVGAPANYRELVEPLPANAKIVTRAGSNVDLVHLFTNSRDDLFRGLSKYKKIIKSDCTIWVSWYKKAAKLPTEITEDTIREACLPLGLVDVKVCSVDDQWSGLKLVIRKENRT